jgi:hypothetical protein
LGRECRCLAKQSVSSCGVLAKTLSYCKGPAERRFSPNSDSLKLKSRGSVRAKLYACSEKILDYAHFLPSLKVLTGLAGVRKEHSQLKFRTVHLAKDGFLIIISLIYVKLSYLLQASDFSLRLPSLGTHTQSGLNYKLWRLKRLTLYSSVFIL